MPLTAQDWYRPSHSFRGGLTRDVDAWIVSTSSTTCAQSYVTGKTEWLYATGTSATTNDDVFTEWVISATSTTENLVWNNWHQHANNRIEVRASEAELAALRAVREQERLRYMEGLKAIEHERKIADARAKRLLVENITQVQRKSLKEKGYFDVNVSGRTYRIKWGSHGNVVLVEGGREVRSFCIQPPDVPAGDAMLAQKLLLETDEQSFLRIANARELRN